MQSRAERWKVIKQPSDGNRLTWSKKGGEKHHWSNRELKVKGHKGKDRRGNRWVGEEG